VRVLRKNGKVTMSMMEDSEVSQVFYSMAEEDEDDHFSEPVMSLEKFITYVWGATEIVEWKVSRGMVKINNPNP